ncbi:type III effector HrpK [Rhizobiales bacterium RZME27]|uniref:Type III effector HrpK n=1 Tax=Endobacterium cereale TaxID=2663029 RepID=A0A6A8AKK9_9HYPH|nr:type III effector HrpK domain-containing protein [Endobacterium cereale]MQY49271.1 type III effector HrpK [Endobacterium cereale]
MAKVNSATSTNPGSGDPESVKAWEQAEKDAKDVGIRWEKPADDKRSAEEIMKYTPIDDVADTKIQTADGKKKTVEEVLKEKVGDYETDEDAAYRAAQVLEHIEKFDENGNRIASNNIDNGEIDGFTSSDDAKNGTEAGRLQDFGKFGFTNLKGKLNDVTSKLDDPEARKKAEDLGIEWERPKGDDRSAQDIIDGDRLLKELGNQSGVKDMLKEQVGDFEKDADAAYRASQVLDHIEKLDGGGKRLVGGDVGDGKINGFTRDNEARANTEAGRLQDFGKNGFASLNGKLDDYKNAGSDKDERKRAEEELGIKWERPEDDKRTAKDIIDGDPLFKQLGDHSGIRDLMKERVGDFDKDADAAYRAEQILRHVELFDSNGKELSGGDVGNGEINGFSKDREAYNGTEAGRLQDFAKDGFSSLKGNLGDIAPIKGKAEDTQSYKDYIKANPDADEASKQIAKYGAILEENYDTIREKAGGSDRLDAGAIKRYMDTTKGLSDETKEALSFWSQPGAILSVDTAKNELKYKPDGKVSKDDLSTWMDKQAPKDAGSLISFLSGVISGNAVGDVDVSKLDKEVFKADSKSSTQEKAAALQELLQAQQLVSAGAGAGMWSSDYGKVAIGTNPDPKEVLKDINEKISILESDPAVVEYMKTNTASRTAELFENNKGLKDVVQKTYDDEVKSGKLLDDLWKTNTKDGKTDQFTALADFYSSASIYQDVLGIKDGSAEIRETVGKSDHAQAFKDYYKDSLASGKRLEELMKDNPFEEALSTFSSEVAVYGAALDSEFTKTFEKDIEGNFNRIANENTFKDGSFDDLKKVFGKNGSDDLDNEKLEKIVTDFVNQNPELVVNGQEKKQAIDAILTGIRGSWDVMRQGTKALADMPEAWMNAATKKGLINPDLKVLSDKGVMHGVSGIFLAGVTIARGAQNSGQLTDKNIVDIVTGSVQTVTVLTEGGIKGYKDHVTNSVVSDSKLANPATEAGRNLKVKLDDVREKHLDELLQYDAKQYSRETIADAKLENPQTEEGKKLKADREATIADAKSDNPKTELGKQLKVRRAQYLEDAKLDDPASDLGKKLKDDLKSTQKTFFDDAFKKHGKLENAAKITGGLAGIVAGAYGIFDGKKAWDRGDHVTGGLNITAGSLGIAAGVAAAGEGAAALAGQTAARAVMAALSGGLGLLAAGFGTIAMFLPGLIEEGKMQARQDDFASLLDQYLGKYEIDGVPYGDPGDLPEDVWGKTSEGMS